MKNIAITQQLVCYEKYGEIRETLDVNWARVLSAINCLPVILPVHGCIRKYLDHMAIDGVLLTGGNDLGRFSQDPLSDMRDRFEKELIARALKKNIPIVGVCRGMQIIADYFGADFVKINGHVAVKHKLKPSPQSEYGKLLSSLKTVNSYHRYAVLRVGDELLISAVSEDGAVEAIEHKKYKVFGQMWHPERTKGLRSGELRLIKAAFGFRKP